MSLVPLLSVGFALAICAGPVLLLRRRAEGPVPPAIVRNAWIAYAVRISVFVPLFASGAAGDLWPAIVGAAGFGVGTCLLGALRRRAGLDEASPATLHAVLAQTCGGAVGVRLAAAAATAVALLGLVGAEAAALVILATPLLGEGFGIPGFAMLVALAGLHAVSAGTDGVRFASQALLGAVFVGIVGSAAFLLYLNASDLRPLPPHGAFALVALAACCAALLAYRQTKYVETPRLVAPGVPAGKRNPYPPHAEAAAEGGPRSTHDRGASFEAPGTSPGAPQDEEGGRFRPPHSGDTSRGRRAVAEAVRLFQRIANVVVSVLAVLAVVLAGMQVYALGLPDVVGGAFAAFGAAPHIPAVGLAAIAVLALTYPLVDCVSWRSAGALAESARAAGSGAAFVRRSIRMVAGETAMFGIVLAAFGAIAALSTDLPPGETGMADVVRQLVLFENEISDAALTLLLVGCFAMAASTMGMAVSAALAVIRLDILPTLRGEERGVDGRRSGEPAVVAVAVAILVPTAAIWIASGSFSAGVADARFFAPALAFACLQVSLLPLLLARLWGMALPGPGATLTMLAAAAAAGLGSIAVHAVAGDVLWLWLAVPACLAAGLLLLAAARPRRRAIPP